MSLWQALFLGFLQGATELFPVSSLGHAVLLPKLLGWHYDQRDPTFLPYIVLLHLGTAFALLFVFRQDWPRLIAAFLRAAFRGRVGDDQDEKLAILLFLGTLPPGILGVFFETELKKLFASPRFAAVFLLVNAAIMAGGEYLRRRQAPSDASSPTEPDATSREEFQLTYRQAVVVGASQGLALLPGISRSGTTITSGLLSGLGYESAARFSFLLATPLILAAGLLEVPSLFGAGSQLPTYVAGAVVAAVTAYLSVRFLLRYFASGRLWPFAIYCAVLGTVGLLFAR
ncbi:MAG TPA: undecaprenyl-diphosphate phosphatase [Candidatus Dormibacteraeota bacterium]|nr:undecaprenyl-diphosphate phosphatase [Candidatus Dormibacteraeota bacterium]